MTDPNTNAPLSELIGGLVNDVSGLLRKEIDLAKTEASEKVSKALGGLEVAVVGLVLAIGAVGVLLSALVSGLAAILVYNGMTQTSASALSALIVAAVIGGIAWLLVSRGVAALRGSNLKLDRTTTSLRRDVDVVKEKMGWTTCKKSPPLTSSGKSMSIVKGSGLASMPFRSACRRASSSMRCSLTPRGAAVANMPGT